MLVDHKGLPEKVAAAWVGLMPVAFPGGEVDINQLPTGLDLSTLTKDPDDEHVCALTVAGSAKYLFTHDDGFLPEPLAALGVEVIRPDDFLDKAIDEDPDIFQRIILQQARVWGGGRSVDELLNALERAEVTKFVEKARELFALDV